MNRRAAGISLLALAVLLTIAQSAVSIPTPYGYLMLIMYIAGVLYLFVAEVDHRAE